MFLIYLATYWMHFMKVLHLEAYKICIIFILQKKLKQILWHKENLVCFAHIWHCISSDIVQAQNSSLFPFIITIKWFCLGHRLQSPACQSNTTSKMLTRKGELKELIMYENQCLNCCQTVLTLDFSMELV